MEKMRNKNKGIFIASIFAIAIITSMAVGNVAAQPAVEVQVAMLLDGSGSISHANWGTIKEGVASAVENPQCLPDDGTVELTVIQFGYSSGTGAKVEVGPVVITSANAGTVANQIRAMPKGDWGTPMAAAFNLAATTLSGSPNFDPSIKQAINLATDGVPRSKPNTEAARNSAITTLAMTTTQDEIDAEGIGITTSNRNWLRDKIVYPQPGYIAPPFKGPGWVRVVADADEFAATVCEKFEQIIPPPSLCPDDYRWGDYEWDPSPDTFVGRQEVHFVNNGQGDAFDVTATVTCVPINVVASEPDVTLGDIPAGGGAWSSDTFELRVDMTNPQDPNKGICWQVEYDDAAGVHHVIENVAKYCGERCSAICP